MRTRCAEVVWSNVWTGMQDGFIDIAYAIIASVAIAYTMQVFAQRSVPSHLAALIMSLEAVFAVFRWRVAIGRRLNRANALGIWLDACGDNIGAVAVWCRVVIKT